LARRRLGRVDGHVLEKVRARRPAARAQRHWQTPRAGRRDEGRDDRVRKLHHRGVVLDAEKLQVGLVDRQVAQRHLVRLCRGLRREVLLGRGAVGGLDRVQLRLDRLKALLVARGLARQLLEGRARHVVCQVLHRTLEAAERCRVAGTQRDRELADTFWQLGAQDLRGWFAL
jgi:hypothetical protein